MTIYDLIGNDHFWLESFDFFFLGCIQLIVFILFKKSPPEEERIQRFGRIRFRALSKSQLIIFYLGIIICCWYLNERFQVFCNLVLPANILLWICISAILTDAFFEVKNKFMSMVLLFFQGIGIAIFFYLLIFWTRVFISGIFFVIFGLYPFWIIALIYFFKNKNSEISRLPFFTVLLSIFVPILLCFQIIENTLPTIRLGKISIIFSLILSLLSTNYILSQYQSFLYKMDSMVYEEVTELNLDTLSPLNQYFLERTVGTHFKYHTRAALMDGWRPPLHDPLYIFCLRTVRESRYSGNISLYKKLFPNLPIRMNCACGKPGSEIYFNDKRLN